MEELGFVQIAILISSFYYFGLIYGLLFIIVLVYTVDAVLDRLGYERAVLGDVLFSFEPRNLNNFGVTYYIMEKIDIDLFRKEIMNRWVMQIRRFRQKLITRFGFKIWKDVGINELSESVAKCDEKCTNLEEVTALANKLTREHRLEENKLPYQFCLLEDYNGLSVVFWVYHHSFWDGIAAASMFSSMDDEPFTHDINRKKFNISLFNKILIFILTPWYLLLSIKSIIKCKSHQLVSSLNKYDGEDEGQTKYYHSKEFSFDKLREAYKRYENATFNDYIIKLNFV